MARHCFKCLGVGWVCENHQSLAWHDELGCQCGAGMPCECNRDGETGVREPNISEVFAEDEIVRH
jgi:hypothetical protein